MHKIFTILPLFLLHLPCVAEGKEQDIWYNASGETVKVSAAEEEPETFVPEWKKRENARLEAQRQGRYHRNSYRSLSRRSSGYYYPSYSYSGYQRSFRRSSLHRRTHSPFRFSSRFRSNGSSLRINF